jgi:hypothetical protein
VAGHVSNRRGLLFDARLNARHRGSGGWALSPVATLLIVLLTRMEFVRRKWVGRYEYQQLVASRLVGETPRESASSLRIPTDGGGFRGRVVEVNRGPVSLLPRAAAQGRPTCEVSGVPANSWPQLSVPRLALVTDVIERNTAVTIAAVATTAERRTYIP